jgi:hypothetical protein
MVEGHLSNGEESQFLAYFWYSMNKYKSLLWFFKGLLMLFHWIPYLLFEREWLQYIVDSSGTSFLSQYLYFLISCGKNLKCLFALNVAVCMMKLAGTGVLLCTVSTLQLAGFRIMNIFFINTLHMVCNDHGDITAEQGSCNNVAHQ